MNSVYIVKTRSYNRHTENILNQIGTICVLKPFGVMTLDPSVNFTSKIVHD